ncbi:DUF1858 domain-containing protein [Streptococcus sanguinis]|uniref:DUF1858 domain-containing protein n=1 Tax=Streptococcus sanguinis TaxID=1305 RepID=UPI00066AC857|nr:DUF1858 domain-containing protein [Streptococcus sanguinis]MCY7013696.1 DUF1858 domain-containing protein [Streptococcus sanguinis]
MDNVIDLSIPVAEVIEKQPEVLDVLVELGFTPLANPVMRNTVGRVVSIKKGASMNGIDLNKIKQTLELNGYEVMGI